MKPFGVARCMMIVLWSEHELRICLHTYLHSAFFAMTTRRKYKNCMWCVCEALKIYIGNVCSIKFRSKQSLWKYLKNCEKRSGNNTKHYVHIAGSAGRCTWNFDITHSCMRLAKYSNVRCVCARGKSFATHSLPLLQFSSFLWNIIAFSFDVDVCSKVCRPLYKEACRNCS